MAKADEKAPVTRIGAGQRRCPMCGKPSETRYRPFCSRRCADVDLGRWLKGNYRVETEEQPDTGSEAGDGER